MAIWTIEIALRLRRYLELVLMSSKQYSISSIALQVLIFSLNQQCFTSMRRICQMCLPRIGTLLPVIVKLWTSISWTFYKMLGPVQLFNINLKTTHLLYRVNKKNETFIKYFLNILGRQNYIICKSNSFWILPHLIWIPIQYTFRDTVILIREVKAQRSNSRAMFHASTQFTMVKSGPARFSPLIFKRLYLWM